MSVILRNIETGEKELYIGCWPECRRNMARNVVVTLADTNHPVEEISTYCGTFQDSISGEHFSKYRVKGWEIVSV
jgi:hypothetical protein